MLYFPKANNKGTNQSVRMRRLVCAVVVHELQTPKTGFLTFKPILNPYKFVLHLFGAAYAGDKNSTRQLVITS